MAIKEVNALIRAKDSANNSCLIYPITKKDNVEGMDEIDAHLSNTSNPHGVTISQIGAAAEDHNHDGDYDALGSSDTALTSAKSYTDNKVKNYLPLSGGYLTGNLTGQYITGTWLQGTANNGLSYKPPRICVQDTRGWVYSRTPEQILGDIGAEVAGSANAALTDARAYTDEVASGKSDSNHAHDDRYYTESEVDEKIDEISSTVVDLSNTVSTNYDESIIGLSIDGQTITYIKGDGSVHTMITQDTNTEYFLATDETTGLTKLYTTVGSAEDGTMTQKAIKTELDKKVGVIVDDSQDTLIFTV